MIMQITHEEARRLIHRKEDDRLNNAVETRLSAHLLACAECRSYQETIREAETVLRQTLQKQWNVHPLPLSMDVIFEKMNGRGRQAIFLATRTALVSTLVFLFAFITWQSMTNGVTAAQQTPLGALPLIPTPATYTATNTLQTDCASVRYGVQDGDTLEGIARQFSVEPESILAANNLTSEPSSLPRELVIPICESTPTSTTHPPMFTITPSLETITTTPG
jgi:hypothetical protein